MNFLIVDDNADARKSLSVLLKMRGHETLEAANGYEALEVMERERPDAIILDLFMPHLNGWEFLDRKAASEQAAIPVIILSGWHQISQPLTDGSGVVGIVENTGEVCKTLDKIEELASRGVSLT